MCPVTSQCLIGRDRPGIGCVRRAAAGARLLHAAASRIWRSGEPLPAAEQPKRPWSDSLEASRSDFVYLDGHRYSHSAQFVDSGPEFGAQRRRQQGWRHAFDMGAQGSRCAQPIECCASKLGGMLAVADDGAGGLHPAERVNEQARSILATEPA